MSVAKVLQLVPNSPAGSNWWDEVSGKLAQLARGDDLLSAEMEQRGQVHHERISRLEGDVALLKRDSRRPRIWRMTHLRDALRSLDATPPAVQAAAVLLAELADLASEECLLCLPTPWLRLEDEEIEIGWTDRARKRQLIASVDSSGEWELGYGDGHVWTDEPSPTRGRLAELLLWISGA